MKRPILEEYYKNSCGATQEELTNYTNALEKYCDELEKVFLIVRSRLTLYHIDIENWEGKLVDEYTWNIKK